MFFEAVIFFAIWIGGAVLQHFFGAAFIVAVLINAITAFGLLYIWSYRVQDNVPTARHLLIDFAVVFVISFPIIYITRLLA
jgi:hypothetical protein